MIFALLILRPYHLNLPYGLFPDPLRFENLHAVPVLNEPSVQSPAVADGNGNDYAAFIHGYDFVMIPEGIFDDPHHVSIDGQTDASDVPGIVQQVLFHIFLELPIRVMSENLLCRDDRFLGDFDVFDPIQAVI